MITKQRIVRILAYTELALIGLMYSFSPHGVQALVTLQQECKEAEVHLARVKQDVEMLKHEIARWQSDSFYKEKIAREQLQMARSGDIIYYIST